MVWNHEPGGAVGAALATPALPARIRPMSRAAARGGGKFALHDVSPSVCAAELPRWNSREPVMPAARGRAWLPRVGGTLFVVNTWVSTVLAGIGDFRGVGFPLVLHRERVGELALGSVFVKNAERRMVVLCLGM